MKSQVLMVLALCGLITISCSQKKNKKRKEVQVEARLIAPILTNYSSGIFFGRNAQGEVFSHWISDNKFFMTFPNSVFDFAIIAWNGATPFTGTTFCDVKPGISLEGGDIALTFNLATGKCNDGIFGTSNTKQGSGSILPSKINTCANFANQIQEENAATGGILPSQMNEIPHCEDEIYGKEQSFKFVYYPFGLTFDPNATRLSPVFSACMVRTDLNSPLAPTSNAVPHVSFPMIAPWFLQQPIEIHAYDSNNCSGSANIINFDLGHDYIAVADKGLVTADPTNGIIAYTVDSQLCTGSYLTAATTFANKDFAINANGDNYIICTAAQLANMNTTLAAPSGIQGHNDNDKFILSANLDLSSLNNALNPIGDASFPFKGQFRGSGFSLSNHNNAHTSAEAGLFGNVGNNAEISDLEINNFNYSFSRASGNNPAGIFIGHVSGNDIEIRDIEINNSSAVLSTYTSANLFLGGAIGQVSAGANERVTVENVKVFGTDVDATGQSPGSMNVGGLIGFSNSTSGGDIEIRDVAFEQGDILGEDTTGGLVGMLQGNSRIEHSFVHVNSSTGNSISGHLYVGGMVGKMFDNSTIYASTADVNIDVNLQSGTAQIGGMVGHIDGGQVIDSSAYSFMDKGAGTTGTFDGTQYGGLVGNCQGGGPGPCLLKNNFVDFNMNNIASSGVGGIVGTLSNGTVIKNYVTGNISDNGFTTEGSRGGVVGSQSATTEVSQNYVDISIAGNYEIGAIAGWSEGIIEMNYASPRAEFRLDGINSGVDLGAIVGQFSQGDHTMGRIWGNTIESTFIRMASTDCTSNCLNFVEALSVYDDDATQKSVSHNLFNGTVIWEDATPTQTTRALGTAQNASGSGVGYENNINYITSTPYNYSSFHVTLVSAIYDSYDSSATDRFLHFVLEMEDIGGILGNQIGIFGNAVDPYPLGDCHDWDQLANSHFLHSKSYELTNDIFFDAGGCPIFVPIGGPVVVGTAPIPFTGSIKANGWWLRNISYDVNVSTGGTEVHDIGIIRRLGSTMSSFPGFIGDWGDPLVIKDSYVHVQSATADVAGGISVGVGHVLDGSVFLRVENSYLDDDSTNSPAGAVGVGGVVGWFERGFMANSGFYYYENATAAEVTNTYVNSNHADTDVAVGGLVGLIGNQNFTSTMARVDIMESVVRSDVLTSNGKVGGVIGWIYDGGTTKETDANIYSVVYNNYLSTTAKFIDNAANNNEGSLIGEMTFGSTSSNFYLNGSLAKLPVGKIDNTKSIGTMGLNGNLTVDFYYDANDVRNYRGAVLFMDGAGADSIDQFLISPHKDSLFFTGNNGSIIHDEIDNNGNLYSMEMNYAGEPTIYWEVYGLHMD